MKTLARLILGVVFMIMACGTNASAFSATANDSYGNYRLNFVAESFGLFKTSKPNVYKGRVTLEAKDLINTGDKENVIEAWFMWDKNTGKFYLTTGKINGVKQPHPKWGPVDISDPETFAIDKTATAYIFYRMWLNNKDTETGEKLDTLSFMDLVHVLKDDKLPDKI